MLNEAGRSCNIAIHFLIGDENYNIAGLTSILLVFVLLTGLSWLTASAQQDDGKKRGHEI